MKYIIPAAVAIGVGLVTLISYLIPVPELLAVRLVLTDWAAILAGLAVLVGVLNLLMVHTRRVEAVGRGWAYSLVTIGAVLFTLLVGVLEGIGADAPAIYQDTSLTAVLFRGIVIASLATLASLVMFFLVTAAVRMLKAKPGGWSIFFLVVVVIVLIGWLPLAFLFPVGTLREWLISVPASGGARGILIGVALGTLVIGLRVLTGTERPYKD